MNKISNPQKKTALTSYVYATIIGMLVVACAVVIALASAKNANPTAEISNEQGVLVSANTYVAPMKNFTIAKDYSATELQYNETLKQWEIHKAIDFLAGDDLQVFAVSNGTVSNVYNNYLEGTVIEITHANSVVSTYKSLSNATVKIGDKVTAGQVIGEAGNNMAQEQNAGKHLHFEMTVNGKKVNPNDYLDLGTK